MPENPAMPAPITLLTDFGSRDIYVGTLKGVIARIAPQAVVIDLNHEIAPQDVLAASFNLRMAYRYFPDGTVHVAVVDPGVGTPRRAIALQTPQGYFVGPDNGLFSGVLAETTVLAAVELNHPVYWRSPQPSQTFHGRDIFAPAGAYLAKGTPLALLGTAVDLATLKRLPEVGYTPTEAGLSGTVQYIDRFGNLITSIPNRVLGQKQWQRKWVVHLDILEIKAVQAYAEQPAGELVALMGSHGWVEIAISCGSAAADLKAAVGDPVEVCWID
ncbi:MAG: SAM-dependent chlorinase/fluorinase [Leptolyngbyaceae cyanobacterium SL_1_1]|nr:SAM-dependent chlorinase/fluorinase [Leptolyngbyaceae cyanobacterium RM1_1_2]NJO10309.1 SAM-dependent chlorinase/fluorinase [Leptolyngbyaceae cyanobacterium SL_1_1]